MGKHAKSSSKKEHKKEEASDRRALVKPVKKSKVESNGPIRQIPSSSMG